MLRPILFFIAFLGAIAVPQIVVHLLNHLFPAQARFEEDEGVLRATAAGFVDPLRVLGGELRLDLVQDARQLYPEALNRAQVAVFGLKENGASVLAARFDDAAAATAARRAFLAMLGKVATREDGLGMTGFDWPGTSNSAILGVAGRSLMVWVGTDRAEAERLREGSGAFRTLAPRPRGGLAGVVDAVRAWPMSRVGSLILVYGLLVSWLFLKLVVWATVVPATNVAQPASLEGLRQRLLEVHALDSPITIGPGANDQQLVVDWKYADAKWVDHARAQGMRKSHRLILELDPATRTVRCREFHTESAWGAGASGASFQWRASWEIVFFQYEHERVFGLQIGPDGRLLPTLSYSYTFDIREMKSPLIATIAEAGWEWRQVFFFSPRWLQWLHG